MALNQAQWYEKLKSFVPGWWFESEEYNVAVFQAFAKLISELDANVDSHIDETFICRAVDGFLAEHGTERNITRNTGEIDAQLAQRIKNIVNTTSCPTLKDIVDALLEVGEATIVEDWSGALFFDRGSYLNRGQLLIDAIYNAFSIIVDKQVHEPYSFLDREYFADREDYIGRLNSSTELFELIIQAVNDSKALGTVYRLVERTG